MSLYTYIIVNVMSMVVGFTESNHSEDKENNLKSRIAKLSVEIQHIYKVRYTMTGPEYLYKCISN